MDLSFIQWQDRLTLTQVRPLVGSNPPALELLGKDFQRARSVEINGITAPDFAILNNHTVRVLIPTSQLKEQISSIAVFSMGVYSVAATRLKPSLLNPRPVSGLERLTQLFVKVLLQSKSGVWQDDGGGLRGMIGRNSNTNRTSELQATVFDAIERTATFITKVQSRDSRIPLSERLLAATTEEVSVSPSAQAIRVRVSLTNQLRETATMGYTA